VKLREEDKSSPVSGGGELALVYAGFLLEELSVAVVGGDASLFPP